MFRYYSNGSNHLSLSKSSISEQISLHGSWTLNSLSLLPAGICPERQRSDLGSSARLRETKPSWRGPFSFSPPFFSFFCFSLEPPKVCALTHEITNRKGRKLPARPICTKWFTVLVYQEVIFYGLSIMHRYARNSCAGLFLIFYSFFFRIRARHGVCPLDLRFHACCVFAFVFFRYTGMRGEGDPSARPMWGLTCGGAKLVR